MLPRLSVRSAGMDRGTVPLHFRQVYDLGQEPSHLLLFWQVGSLPRPGPPAGTREARRVKGEESPPLISRSDSEEQGFHFNSPRFLFSSFTCEKAQLEGRLKGKLGQTPRPHCWETRALLSGWGIWGFYFFVCLWGFVVTVVLSRHVQPGFQSKAKPSSQVQKRSALRLPTAGGGLWGVAGPAPRAQGDPGSRPTTLGPGAFASAEKSCLEIPGARGDTGLQSPARQVVQAARLCCCPWAPGPPAPSAPPGRHQRQLPSPCGCFSTVLFI